MKSTLNLESPVSPTDPFTTLELQNPSHDVSELHEICRSPDLKALKLWKGRSGVCACVGSPVKRKVPIFRSGPMQADLIRQILSVYDKTRRSTAAMLQSNATLRGGKNPPCQQEPAEFFFHPKKSTMFDALSMLNLTNFLFNLVRHRWRT